MTKFYYYLFLSFVADAYIIGVVLMAHKGDKVSLLFLIPGAILGFKSIGGMIHELVKDWSDP